MNELIALEDQPDDPDNMSKQVENEQIEKGSRFNEPEPQFRRSYSTGVATRSKPFVEEGERNVDDDGDDVSE